MLNDYEWRHHDSRAALIASGCLKNCNSFIHKIGCNDIKSSTGRFLLHYLVQYSRTKADICTFCTDCSSFSLYIEASKSHLLDIMHSQKQIIIKVRGFESTDKTLIYTKSNIHADDCSFCHDINITWNNPDNFV